MEGNETYFSEWAFFKLTFACDGKGGEGEAPRLDEAIWLNIKIYFCSAPFTKEPRRGRRNV